MSSGCSKAWPICKKIVTAPQIFPYLLIYIRIRLYLCSVFHGIRFKVSEDWLSRDNQFFVSSPEYLTYNWPMECLSPDPSPKGEEKTKTGKTPCAGCKMSLASHGRCIRLNIPRASSGIFRRLHHPPVGFCIRCKAINKKNKPCPLRQETLPP